MTTASNRRGVSLSISAYRPTISGATYTPEGLYVDTITDQVENYSHNIRAFGGYWSSTFKINDRQNKIEDWIANGLGRHIVVHDPSLSVIWEGFVNRISANLGALAIQRGPLMDVANRVNVIYSTVDTTVDPPAVGVRTRTGVAEDDDAQARYGILEEYVSASGMTDDEADEVRNQYLAERMWPKTSQTLSLGRRGEPSVKVDCLGYMHFFNKYVYNQTAASALVNLSTKLQNVISGQLNSIIDETYSKIDANTVQVRSWENDDNTAMNLLKELVSLGDASDNRHLFGVYKNREPIYEAAPTDLDYQMRLADPTQRIETVQGTRVLPWNVMPGKWMLFSDLLIGRSESDTLRLDPRAMFIESVTYRAPWKLTLKGGDTDRLPQKMAKLGLGGVSE